MGLGWARRLGDVALFPMAGSLANGSLALFSMALSPVALFSMALFSMAQDGMVVVSEQAWRPCSTASHCEPWRPQLRHGS